MIARLYFIIIPETKTKAQIIKKFGMKKILQTANQKTKKKK
jgi:hypothetical protein